MGAAARTTGGYAGAISQATIDDIRTRMGSGKIIYRNDVVAIYNGLFNSVGHTHSYYDQLSLHDFGNVNGGSSAVYRDTGGGSNGQSGFALSAKIYASELNTMQYAAAGWKDHVHYHVAS